MIDSEDRQSESGKKSKELSNRGLAWVVAISLLAYGLMGLESLLVGEPVDWTHPVALVLGLLDVFILIFKRPFSRGS